jgi:hypothetical protein
MTTKVVRGSNQEIADLVGKFNGRIVEAILVIEEPADLVQPLANPDFLAEMEPHMVDVASFDDSREAIYTRQEGE